MSRVVSSQGIQPQYAARFKCTGPDCEDTCCAGWAVTVDHETFEKYTSLQKRALRERVKTGVTPAPKKGRQLSVWGQINLDPKTKACVLLDDKMCAVQKELGEEGLSDTCYTYPRQDTEFDGLRIRTLTLSCPEAARLALLSPDAFTLVEGELKSRDLNRGVVQPRDGFTVQQMQEVAFFCVQLMNTSDLELWERLAVLGLFTEDLTKLIEGGKQDALGALIEGFVGTIQAGGLKSALGAMKPDHAFQAEVFAHIFDLSDHRLASPERQERLLAVYEGLGIDTKTGQCDRRVLIERYRQGIERLPEVLRDAPFLLDHAVRNEVLTKSFPFGANSPRRHYLQLISRYGILRLMLAAQCAHNPATTANDLVATVQTFSRSFQHNAKLAKAVLESLESRGLDRLDVLYRFLRT